MNEPPPVDEVIYVVYGPYLPLAKRVTIGSWELIPRASLLDDDALDAEAAMLARGLAHLYELPARTGGGVGAFARLDTHRVGDDPRDGGLITDLHRGLVLAVLDGNESPLLPEDEQDPNAGHRAMTSDNAIVVANGIKRDGGWTVAITGGRVQRLEAGISVVPDERRPTRPTIAAPSDLRVPLMPRPLDDEYGDAAWDSIRRGTDPARRLGRAIDWLDLAWRNASAISDELRIPALRAGYEVLLDSGDTPELRARPSNLLDARDAPTLRRTWTTLAGKQRSEEMTDLAWWFMQFSFLRNELMHGGAPTTEAWAFEGSHQIDLSEWWLRQAIKETVALDGHEDIRDEPIWRDAFRFVRERRQSPGQDGEG